jgi:hypothetical protein
LFGLADDGLPWDKAFAFYSLFLCLATACPPFATLDSRISSFFSIFLFLFRTQWWTFGLERMAARSRPRTEATSSPDADLPSVD